MLYPWNICDDALCSSAGCIEIDPLPSFPPFGCLAGAQDKLALARRESKDTAVASLDRPVFIDSRLRGNDGNAMVFYKSQQPATSSERKC